MKIISTRLRGEIGGLNLLCDFCGLLLKKDLFLFCIINNGGLLCKNLFPFVPREGVTSC